MSLDTKALENLIKDSGLSYQENSVSWIFTCPRCNKSRKLYLHKTNGKFVCWRCRTTSNFSGKPEYALAELLQTSLRSIKEKLYGATVSKGDVLFLDISLSDFFGEDDYIPTDLLPLPQVSFPEDSLEISDPRAARGLEYLEGRGIGIELAQKFDLRYRPCEQRVLFPVVIGGFLVGWQARHIRDRWTDDDGREWSVIKILTNPKSFERDRCLMFQDQLQGADHAILLEGPIDAIKCHLCGPVVASMGKSVSRGQLEILRDSGIKRLYLGLDPDAAEEKTRLCREFADIEVYEMLPPEPYGDFGEMTPEEVLHVFRQARRISAGFVFTPPHVDFFTVAAGQRLE